MKLAWKKRYVVLAILFFAWMISYMDRMVMATAIPYIAKEWGLSPVQMGVVMSAFFVGYALVQIPGGILADKFGARMVSTVALLWWSAFTSVTGAVSSLMAMIGARVAFGLGEGVFPPCSFKSVSVWFPKKERGLAQAWMISSNSLGPAVAPLFVAAVMSSWGWRSVFYSLFIPGVIIAGLVWVYIRNNPAEAQGITQEELNEINEIGQGQNEADKTPETQLDFWQTFAHEAVWKTFFIMLTLNVVVWGFTFWLPSYLVQTKGLSLAKMGIEASLPFVAGTIGLIFSGWLSDKKFSHNRKIPIIIGEVFAAICLYLMFSVTDSRMASIYQDLAGFFMFWALGATAPLPLAVIPRNAAGKAMGIVNTGGQIAGFCSPLLIGYILQITNNSYSMAFTFIAGSAVVSALIAATIRQERYN